MLEKLDDHFERLSETITAWSGSPYAFALAATLVLGWLSAGLLFGFDNALYHLAINSPTTVITFLMVFVIQASQNRSDKALHLKLDELIKAVEGARDELIEAEKQSTKKLDEYRQSLK
jgi:low affinity Fe/Cu permease